VSIFLIIYCFGCQPDAVFCKHVVRSVGVVYLFVENRRVFISVRPFYFTWAQRLRARSTLIQHGSLVCRYRTADRVRLNWIGLGLSLHTSSGQESSGEGYERVQRYGGGVRIEGREGEKETDEIGRVRKEGRGVKEEGRGGKVKGNIIKRHRPTSHLNFSSLSIVRSPQWTHRRL